MQLLLSCHSFSGCYVGGETNENIDTGVCKNCNAMIAVDNVNDFLPCRIVNFRIAGLVSVLPTCQRTSHGRYSKDGEYMPLELVEQCVKMGVLLFAGFDQKRKGGIILVLTGDFNADVPFPVIPVGFFNVIR